MVAEELFSHEHVIFMVMCPLYFHNEKTSTPLKISLDR